jgi:hypothetical protein
MPSERDEMTDESGQYDARSLRRRHMSLPISWAVIISVCGALVTWGMSYQRLNDVQARQTQQEDLWRQAEAHMASQDTEIAVVKAEYAEIIRRLDQIQERLDRSDHVQ